MQRVLKRFWGGLNVAERQLSMLWIDLAMVAGIVGVFYGLFRIAREWHGVMQPTVAIDLSLWSLPWYTFLSLSRGLLAYLLSLAFTFAYGYWAAKDRRAERVLIPLLDILQSIPVLGFMPGLVIALVALFPHSNTGLELAAVLMIFTGQVWNMTFAFYRGLQTVPKELREAATVFGFSRWQLFRTIELPATTNGLVWNSMMSMAGGWFFLMVSEAFVLGDKDFRLPGLGSYMTVAVAAGDVGAELAGIVAMVVMIVALDQVLWRPLVVWAQKFRVEDQGGEQATSWFLDLLQRSRALRAVPAAMSGCRRLLAPRPSAAPPRREPAVPAPPAAPVDGVRAKAMAGAWSLLPLIAMIALLAWGAWSLALIVLQLPLGRWADIGTATGATLVRVVLATALATLWTVPAGLAIGLSPRWSRILQPFIQVVASFPAPMLFPIAIAAMALVGIPLSVGSVVLMLLGTQWYILFNVIAGAMAIPGDLREAFKAYGITGRQRFRQLYLPALFPYLVTGWVTAMGGAWNASIVAEYVSYGKTTLITHGLGALISQAAAASDLPLLAASVVVMAAVVVGINRLVWRRLYRLAETSYSLDK